MKVLISNPPWFVPTGALKSKAQRMGIRAGSRWPYTRKIHRKYFPFPFNMAYADAHLKQMGIDSTLRDSILLLDEYEDYFKIASNFDYVVMETASASWENDYYVAKEVSKKSQVIFVGMHATAFAEELIRLDGIYAVLKGEYERNLYECLCSGMGGVYDFDEWEDVDDAPIPTRDKTIYQYRARRDFMLQLWASRGCPYKCSFCYVTCFQNSNRYRPHGPERIEREVEGALKRFPKLKFIYFDDDTFNIGDTRIREISRRLKRFGLPWGAMCRADTCNLETFRAMRESGCVELKIGIESGSQRVLDKIINKSLNLEKAKKTIKELKKMGFHVHGTFMYGFPTETPKEAQMTRDVMSELQCNSKQFSHVGLLGGTAAWKEFEKTHKRRPTTRESDGVLLKEKGE